MEMILAKRVEGIQVLRCSGRQVEHAASSFLPPSERNVDFRKVGPALLLHFDSSQRNGVVLHERLGGLLDNSGPKLPKFCGIRSCFQDVSVSSSRHGSTEY